MALTHFGFQQVDSTAKPKLVQDLFNRVARRYDLMNDVMSFGLQRLWKQRFVETVAAKPDEKILDLAGGTGDSAARLLRQRGAGEPIVVCDLAPEMIAVGQARAYDEGFFKQVRWQVGDALALPYAAGTFDICTLAFGLRNMTDISTVLHEVRRVLKPQGRFYCLELAPVSMPVVRRFYDFYSFNLVPRLGQVVAGDRAAYQYLVESIRNFPAPARLQEMILDAGFKACRYETMTLGVVAIHRARVA